VIGISSSYFSTPEVSKLPSVIQTLFSRFARVINGARACADEFEFRRTWGQRHSQTKRPLSTLRLRPELSDCRSSNSA